MSGDRKRHVPRPRVLAALLLATMISAVAVLGGRADSVSGSLSREEASRILALGPWPAPWRPDPSNRVSGNADAIVLGRLLFFDARLSPGGTHACSSCHRPERAWTDGRATAAGLETSRRNTPSLLDVRYRGAFGWDGAADSLWAQSLRPILDPREMGSSAEYVRKHIASDADLSGRYRSVFGRTADQTPADDVLVDAAKALAAFQETIVSPSNVLDDLHNAIANGSTPRRDAWSDPAIQGLRLFLGKAGCGACHNGATLGGDNFHAVVADRPDRPPDPGRAGGIESASRSPYTLASRFNDALPLVVPPPLARDSDYRAFRVPNLRGVKATAPYLHDGSAATLAHAILRHEDRVAGVTALTPDEIIALVAFLELL